MAGWLYEARSVLGVAALAVSIGGCATQRDESLRLSEELGHARADAAWQQARAAELEQRVSRLEQRAAAGSSAQRAEESGLLSRLDHLLELNERLLAERSAASAAQPGNAGNEASQASNATPSAPAPNQEQELRQLVERMRGHHGSLHGGLTREQEDALRVLTRPERVLDSENPWPAAFY